MAFILLFRFQMYLFGPFIFIIINLEEKTSNTAKCLTRCRLMSIRLAVTLASKHKKISNTQFCHYNKTFLHNHIRTALLVQYTSLFSDGTSNLPAPNGGNSVSHLLLLCILTTWPDKKLVLPGHIIIPVYISHLILNPFGWHMLDKLRKLMKITKIPPLYKLVFINCHCNYMHFSMMLFCLSDCNKGCQQEQKKKKYGWCQNKDYVGAATCWSSDWL